MCRENLLRFHDTPLSYQRVSGIIILYCSKYNMSNYPSSYCSADIHEMYHWALMLDALEDLWPAAGWWWVKAGSAVQQPDSVRLSHSGAEVGWARLKAIHTFVWTYIYIYIYMYIYIFTHITVHTLLPLSVCVVGLYSVVWPRNP